jgi:RNA polymerase-binding transcription factor DksA
MAAKKIVKPIAKQPTAKKVVAKHVAVKVAGAKKVALKKPVSKVPLQAKAPEKVKSSSFKTAKSINKSAPVKKTAMPTAKKAAPKKLPTSIKKSNIATKIKDSSLPKKQDLAIKGSSKKEMKAEKSSKIPLSKAKDTKVPPAKPVVLPKISTTKSRRYEPEFTKSVLDQAPPENNGPSMRYSDGELNEFKELIQRKLETAKKELGYLQGLITRKDEMGGDESDNRYMTMEDGSLSMEREQLSQMASRQITFIDHLEKAMMRIENKTYGICRVTGKLIDKARLRAVPHATLCIEAKMGIVK